MSELPALDLTPHNLVNETHMGNMDHVKQIIESGVNPDDYGTNSMPALTCASANGNYNIVKYLLEQGSNPNNYTDTKLSAFKSAANVKSLKIVKLLLERGAEPNYEKDGKVALTLACDCNEGKNDDEIELVSVLLPLTDPSYYQKAYQISVCEKIRSMIKMYAHQESSGSELSLDTVFVEPEGGFGSEYYKKTKVWETPPNDPILRQLWDLLDICMKNTDPNSGIFLAYEKMALSECPDRYYEDGKLSLGQDTYLALDRMFRSNKIMKEDHPEIYERVVELANEYYGSDSESE